MNSGVRWKNMAKKECPIRSNASMTVYCQEENCAHWNDEVGECDPIHWGIFFIYLEALIEEALP